MVGQETIENTPVDEVPGGISIVDEVSGGLEVSTIDEAFRSMNESQDGSHL